jgi:two-component system, cell cycle response regulator DivK
MRERAACLASVALPDNKSLYCSQSHVERVQRRPPLQEAGWSGRHPRGRRDQEDLVLIGSLHGSFTPTRTASSSVRADSGSNSPEHLFAVSRSDLWLVQHPRAHAARWPRSNHTNTGSAHDSGGRRGRVLFVHPAGPDRELYLSALDHAGFTTTVEATVAAAVTVLETESPPDVIVMELLPEPFDAWAFIERRCANAPEVPVVILTSLIRPDRANRQKARALGCAAFVAKPCSVQQLVDVVSQVHDGTRGLEISTYDGSRGGTA